MKLKALHKKSLSSDDQSYEVYSKFQNLIQILHKKDLPSNLITDINTDIEAINTSSNSGKSLKKLIHNKQSSIVKLIEKEVKLVPKNHYKTLWLAIGIPIGVVIGMSTGNMAFLGIGLPIGLGIGVAIGTQMDKKAMEEGRQLNIEL
jgi:hypothetical protein